MKENKRIAIAEAISHIKDGDTIMVGGFMANGTPEALIDALVDKGTKDLTLICNDAGFVDRGVGKMVANHQFKTIYATHIGLNKEAGRQMTAGETTIELIPQGTFAEKILWHWWLLHANRGRNLSGRRQGNKNHQGKNLSLRIPI